MLAATLRARFLFAGGTQIGCELVFVFSELTTVGGSRQKQTDEETTWATKDSTDDSQRGGIALPSCDEPSGEAEHDPANDTQRERSKKSGGVVHLGFFWFDE